jgi:MerR family transcriptional regulator, redox-sensitive transcriptional activator SoxR
MMEKLTIGEVAALAGLQTSTLRYYESIGILPPPNRISGQRRYSREILSVLAIIQLAKEANFSLPEIKTLLYGEGSIPSERWRQLAKHKLHEVNAIIARAEEMKLLLEESLDSEALHYELDECMLLMCEDQANTG